MKRGWIQIAQAALAAALLTSLFIWIG
jgi:hypothetical protein